MPIGGRTPRRNTLGLPAPLPIDRRGDRCWRFLSVEPLPTSPPSAGFVWLSPPRVMVATLLATPSGWRRRQPAGANVLTYHGMEYSGHASSGELTEDHSR